MYVNKYFNTRYYFTKQESIPVGCIPPTFLILGGGGSLQRPLWTETYQTEPPGQRPTKQRPSGQRPLEGTWDQAVRQ